MYSNILKKDLKRKKTMNIIVMILIIFATMFAASSANNIITVVGGLDNYFAKANLSDYIICSMNKSSDDTAFF